MENSNDVPPELWFGMAAMVLIMVIFFALYLTLVIWSMIWVAKDAELRGKSGILLAILMFFTWPLGLLVWVIADAVTAAPSVAAVLARQRVSLPPTRRPPTAPRRLRNGARPADSPGRSRPRSSAPSR
jgi:hypothetical protein